MKQIIRIKFCKEADIEHKRISRWYAHTGHRKNVICIATAIKNLPDNFVCGIILHELGHILSDYRSEEVADQAIKDYFGITIKYKILDANKLEWVSDTDIKKITNDTKIFPGYFLKFQIEEKK